MSDDKSKRDNADRSRINIHEEHEVRYWSTKLDCTREQLVDAVEAAGVNADKVELYLAAESARRVVR